jgi:hypothetical protein
MSPGGLCLGVGALFLGGRRGLGGPTLRREKNTGITLLWMKEQEVASTGLPLPTYLQLRKQNSVRTKL